MNTKKQWMKKKTKHKWTSTWRNLGQHKIKSKRKQEHYCEVNTEGDGQVVLLQWKWPRHIEVLQTKKTMDDGYYTYVEIRLMSTL